METTLIVRGKSAKGRPGCHFYFAPARSGAAALHGVIPVLSSADDACVRKVLRCVWGRRCARLRGVSNYRLIVVVREPSAVNSRKVRDLPADIGIGEVNCQKVAATGEMLCYILVVIQKHGK